MTGYCHCACRDCFEIAIGEAGKALCHDCETAGCTPDDPYHNDCQADHCKSCGCHKDNPEDCKGCEYEPEF